MLDATEAPPARTGAGSLTWQSLPLASAIAIYGLTAAGLSPTLSLFLANAVHTAPVLIGLFFTARAAAGIVAGLATGWVSDRMRDRRVLLGLVGLGGAVGALCLALLRDYTWLLVTCVVFTSIGSGSFGQLFAYANESATARGRDVTAYSSMMRSVFSGAYVVGAPLSLSIMARYGFRPLYLGVAALTLASAVIGRWGLRRAPRKAIPAAVARERRTLRRVLRGASLPARAWLLLGVILALGTVNQMYGIDIALHVTKDLGRSAELVGWMLALAAAMEIPVMITAGRLAARVGSGRLVGLSAVLATVCYCLIPLVSSPDALLGVAALFGVWQGVALSIPMVMVQNESPGGVGTSSSIYGAAFGSAGLIAGAITGVTASAVGYGGVLWVCAGLSAVAVVLMLARFALARRTAGWPPSAPQPHPLRAQMRDQAGQGVLFLACEPTERRGRLRIRADGGTGQGTRHRDAGLQCQLDLPLVAQVLAQLPVEPLAYLVGPAQSGRPRVLHAHDRVGGVAGALRMAAHHRRAEQLAGRERLRVAGQRHPRAHIVRAGQPHLVQDRAEGVVVALGGAEDGEPAAGPQQPGGLHEPDLRVDPVKRRPRDDQVERGVRRVQILEGHRLERDSRPGQATLGDRDHERADVDGRYPETPGREGNGQLSRSAPDVEDGVADTGSGGGDDEVDKVIRVSRPRVLVKVGHAIEQFPLVPPLVAIRLGLRFRAHGKSIFDP
jgi:SET family sugar efflux transporter-like MFS transporter